MFSSTFWTPYFRNEHIPDKRHYYSLSNSLSFLYFFSKSVRYKGKMNTTVTGSEVKHVRQIVDFIVFESALGS